MKTGWEREIKTHFDDIAVNYDKVRWEYPSELYADIFEYLGAGHKTALEIGAGTGKATAPILNAGYDVTAVEMGGILSVVKHNRIGRVIGTAVFKNDPKKALSLLDENANDEHIYLGTQYIYSNDYISALVNENGDKVKAIYGMRAFHALGQDNSLSPNKPAIAVLAG